MVALFLKPGTVEEREIENGKTRNTKSRNFYESRKKS
jgi:hypothetical protein